MTSMDSWEYAQWMAFERSHGPIGGEWTAESLSSIQEQLQQVGYLLGQAHFTDKTHRRGPVDKPERFPRPWESLKRIAVPLEDFDESEWLDLTEDELLDVTIDQEEMGDDV